LVKSFIIFLSVFIGKHGPDTVIRHVDTVQQNIFTMVLPLWLSYGPQINGKIERKSVVIAMTDMLCKSDRFFVPPYSDFAPQIVKCVIEICENQESAIVPPEEDAVVSGIGEDVDAISSGFSTLVHASRSQDDPFPNEQDPRAYLVRSLHNAGKMKPGKYAPLLQSNVKLQEYFHMAQIPLV